MIYLLILFNQFLLITGQVILICNQQSDCYVGDYCDIASMCYDCSYINPSSCGSIDNNCCSQAFLKQCNSNPFNCPINNIPIDHKKTESNIYLYLFLYVFLIGGAFYISFGMYYNQYVNNKKGIEMVPNINFWKEVYGLVKDGLYFTMDNIKNRNIDYISLE